ncbi:hypothetical protein [Bacillus infantis]|uniref:hypothetical protein n=1 Tax=Bacillus infantis TaxID=324767 RepID=UPI003CF57CEA
MIDPKEYALVFVQKEVGRDWTLYQDGKEVAGLKSVDINADIDYMTEHTLKFVTGAKSEDKII